MSRKVRLIPSQNQSLRTVDAFAAPVPNRPIRLNLQRMLSMRSLSKKSLFRPRKTMAANLQVKVTRD